MGKLQQSFLHGDKVYTCAACGTHLASADEILSKNFQSHSGKAYLFTTVVNVHAGEQEDRMLRTGMHTVADVHCDQCGVNVGWTYFAAHEPDQKYKEGKFVLEKARLGKLRDEHELEHLECESVPSDEADSLERAKTLRPIRVARREIVSVHGIRIVFQQPASHNSLLA